MPRVSPEHEHQVRTRIVTAALGVFAEKGYHGSTIADIVRESGCSVGAIYTWFAGKDAIYLATCDLSAGQGLGELAERIAAGRTTAERLAIAVAFFLDTVETPPGAPDMAAFLVQAWAQADVAPAVREMLARRREQFMTTGQILAREGLARRELPAWIDVDGLIGGFLALLDGLILQRVEAGPGWRRATAERRAAAMLEILIAAAAAPERPAVPVIPGRPYSAVRAAEPPRDPGRLSSTS